MTKKKQNKTVQLLIGAAVGAAVGFFLTYGIIIWTPDFIFQNLKGSGGIWWENPLKLILAFLAIWAALAAHELGHLLTGLYQGFTFHLYVAGFLGVRRNSLDDKIEWYLNRDANLFGGVAATLPTQKSPDLAKKLAAVVAAGPLTSIGGALFVGVPAFWATMNLSVTGSNAALRVLLVFSLIFALTSLFLFLATTIPGRTGAFFTDRARFFRLIGGGKTAAIEQAVLEVLAHSHSNQPYATVDPTQIELIQSDDSDLMKAFAHSLNYYYHLDRGEKDLALSAAKEMEPLLEEQPLTFRVELQKDLVFAYAFLANDPVQARSIWEKMGKLGQTGKDAHTHLAKAALFSSEGNLDEAKAAIEAGLAALPGNLVKYSDRFYRGWFEELEERCLS
ncbi:MAG: hypothetical protein SFV55_25330 [Haliscomenobacter sp.]|uniref:hypothetical protein n=1 Tax=Haliscomenobacter sp. TaxID=2717303 RepID=UPI0029AB1D97|nr:hypothetical protein [Haliscomenobacter sp.]MDX2071780.1 hypothetical protein [Haliscomenobacter sp.]